MKKIVSILLAMTLLLSGVSAMAAVTFEGTQSAVWSENFSSGDGTLTTKYSGWTLYDGTTVVDTEDSTITVTDGVLKLNKVSTSKRWAGYALSSDECFSFAGGEMLADEYVMEFKATLRKNMAVQLKNLENNTAYFTIGCYNTDDAVSFWIDGSNSNVITLSEDTSKNHTYKVVLRAGLSDAGRLEIYADVYVDGVCRVLNERAFEGSSNSKRIGDTFCFSTLANAKSYIGSLDDIDLYYLNDQERSDVCTKYLDSTGATLSKNATNPAETMRKVGSMLTAEIRYQGTVSEAETVRVFVAQFNKDGVLKNVSFADGTVTDNNKITVPVESTEANQLCIDAEADDYLTAFIWTADEMLPLCTEASIGK